MVLMLLIWAGSKDLDEDLARYRLWKDGETFKTQIKAVEAEIVGYRSLTKVIYFLPDSSGLGEEIFLSGGPEFKAGQEIEIKFLKSGKLQARRLDILNSEVDSILFGWKFLGAGASWCLVFGLALFGKSIKQRRRDNYLRNLVQNGIAFSGIVKQVWFEPSNKLNVPGKHSFTVEYEIGQKSFLSDRVRLYGGENYNLRVNTSITMFYLPGQESGAWPYLACGWMLIDRGTET